MAFRGRQDLADRLGDTLFLLSRQLFYALSCESLRMYASLIPVDRKREFRNVPVINSKTTDLATSRPFTPMPLVLAQAIGECRGIHYLGRRQAASARLPQPMMKARPPNGVTIPNERVPVRASR